MSSFSTEIARIGLRTSNGSLLSAETNGTHKNEMLGKLDPITCTRRRPHLHTHPNVRTNRTCSIALHTHVSARPSILRAGKDAFELPGVVYVLSDDPRLYREVRAIVTIGCWFRSASRFFAHQRGPSASCLLIGPSLSDMGGLELQRMLAGTFAPPIILLSDGQDIPSCVRAIKDGVHDFLTLPLIRDHLLDAVHSAFEVDRRSLQLRRENERLRSRWHSLTSREAEVMRYAVAGFLNKQTAAELRIAENTVQVHRGRVMRKMGADSFAELVRLSLTLAEWGEDSLLHTPQRSRVDETLLFDGGRYSTSAFDGDPHR